MIKRLLRSIRQKPKAFRDQIALSVAIVVTGSIFVVWLITAPARFGTIAPDTADSQVPDVDAPGFAEVFSGFGEMFNQTPGEAASGTAATNTAEMNAAAEPTLSEKLDTYVNEQAVLDSQGTSSAPTSTAREITPVGVWSSMPTTSVEREVRIVPVDSQASSSVSESPLE